MTQKEKFLEIKTFEEYKKRKSEFKGMNIFDPEISKHFNSLFPKMKNSGYINGVIYEAF